MVQNKGGNGSIHVKDNTKKIIIVIINNTAKQKKLKKLKKLKEKVVSPSGGQIWSPPLPPLPSPSPCVEVVARMGTYPSSGNMGADRP